VEVEGEALLVAPVGKEGEEFEVLELKVVAQRAVLGVLQFLTPYLLTDLNP